MSFNLMRFKTLLLREWLQNRWTWAIVVGVLPVLVLLVTPFGDVSLPAQAPVQLVAGATIGISALVAVMVAWATVLFMAPGLARRDVQDRSIEFWLSLPSTHPEHVGAQYVAHALLFPLGALAVGLGFGALLMPLILFKWQGMAALAAVDWAGLVSWMGATAATAVFSLVLLALWLAPVVMLLMALSAWVKRLALPLLLIASSVLANLPSTAPQVRAAARMYRDMLAQLVEGAVRAFAQWGDGSTARAMDMPPARGMGFMAEALGNLATPQFAVAVAVTLLCAYALVLRRQRG